MTGGLTLDIINSRAGSIAFATTPPSWWIWYPSCTAIIRDRLNKEREGREKKIKKYAGK